MSGTEIAGGLPVELLRPQAARVTAVTQPVDARRHVEAELATREDRPGAAPHQLASLVARVRGDQLREPLEIGPRRREPLEHEPDPRLTHPEAALGVVVGKVRRGVERTLEIRDVVASELDEASACEPVERSHDTRGAEIHGPKPCGQVAVVLGVLRMRRPPVVEGALRVDDDRGDRASCPVGAPQVTRERLVRLGLEQHSERSVSVAFRARPTFRQLDSQVVE